MTGFGRAMGPVLRVACFADNMLGIISLGLVALACAAMLASGGMILLEIFLRAAFSLSTFLAAELVGYGVAVTTFFALPYTFRQGEHIRAEILVGSLTGRVRRMVEFACGSVALAFTTLASWYLAGTMLRHLGRGTLADSGSGIPLWWPYAALVVGMAVLSLEIAAYLIRIVGNASPWQRHDPLRPGRSELSTSSLQPPSQG